jgi:hypothetical protein
MKKKIFFIIFLLLIFILALFLRIYFNYPKVFSEPIKYSADDGSFDNTKDLLKQLNKKFSFILISHPKSQGKGAATRTGLSQAAGDFILIQDADLEYFPEDYPILLKPY